MFPVFFALHFPVQKNLAKTALVMEKNSNKYLLPVPEKFNLNENAREVIIEKKWLSPRHIALCVFALIWNSMLVFFYSAMLMGQVPYFIYLFPILHVAAGIWMLYTSLCGFFNKTIIRADKQQITVRHTPLPWSGQKTVDNQDIHQLYVIQQIKSNRSSTYITYDVQLITKNNKALPLVKGLETAEEARFIEQKLETFLHIENNPVSGAFTS
jgi:hypothetical protein